VIFRAVVISVLLLVLLPLPVGAQDPERKERDERFVEKVNDAIDRGALWLVKQQREDGSFEGYDDKYPMGMTSLGLLTLLKCDYPRNSDAVKKGLKLLFERYKDQNSDRLKTYSVAILMMVLEELHAEKRAEKISVGNRYGPAHRVRRVKLPNRDLKWMTELTRWMVRSQTESVWRYPRRGIDHSNTQYALLGLAAARRCGIPVSREVFLRAAMHLLDVQEKDGPLVPRILHVDQGDGYARRYAMKEHDKARGWGYTPGAAATGSMTTAGVSSLAICRSELLGWVGLKGAFGARLTRGIRDGSAWLDKSFTVRRNPGGRGWHYYYLFGLERAGVLTDARFLGDHDWYREGAEFLVARQDRNGCWAGGRGEGTLAKTCFALLFLRRATTPVRVPKSVTPAPSDD